ncbi:MAG: CoA ester lyase [Chloroflexi bacterium]|nr:CoA ester lyase [Chloroflexota bacterium]
MELLRSLLFVPGNRRDMLEKAVGFGADVLVPDMEDSVPASEKAKARGIIADMMPYLAQEGRRIVVRVNALDTGLLEEDLEAAVTHHTYGVNVGKVEKPWDVQQVEYIMRGIEARKGLEWGGVKLVLYIESALAVINAFAICSSSPRIVAVAFGAEDFTVDMDIRRTEEASEVLLPRAMVAMAARAAHVVPLDIVYTNFRDEDGLRRDIQAGKSVGYKGKFAIHPSQVAPINSMYSPLPEEVEYARRVVEVFKEAEAQGRGATSLDGQMVDIPVVKRAESLLDMAQAIAERLSQARE